MDSWKRMLLGNKAWVAERLAVDPGYFSKMSVGQQPTALWIGCSDSRVPAEIVTGVEPGELFVHRNIANLVVHTDFNLMSVLSYAVEYLKVDHIVVCGHYGCGGVQAAMTHDGFGLLNKWLRQIKDTYAQHRSELIMLKDLKKRAEKLVELNVVEQVHNLVKTSIVQRAWMEREGPMLHGWVYGLEDGLLHDILRVEPNSEIEDIFRFDLTDEDHEEMRRMAAAMSARSED